MSFAPGTPKDDWVSALTADERGGRVFTDESGVKFQVESARTAVDHIPIDQMNSPTWVAYAARTLVLRFWDLAKKADSLDILLILAGYLLMHTTFFLLIIRSRKLGSNFWLPLAIVSSAILALLISLPIAMALRIPIDPVALTEALPFLVCTVGFDKPLRLARAVFTHPHLLASPTPAAQMKPAPKIITESLTKVYPPIIRDYFLEIAVLVVGAYSKVGGLKEVCALAALILGVDCVLLCTYLAAILGVMIEVSLFLYPFFVLYLFASFWKSFISTGCDGLTFTTNCRTTPISHKNDIANGWCPGVLTSVEDDLACFTIGFFRSYAVLLFGLPFIGSGLVGPDAVGTAPHVQYSHCSPPLTLVMEQVDRTRAEMAEQRVETTLSEIVNLR